MTAMMVLLLQLLHMLATTGIALPRAICGVLQSDGKWETDTAAHTTIHAVDQPGCAEC